MKQYKHKTVNATAELCSDGYWYLIKYFDKDGDETTRFSIPKYLIENTNDWEEIKPEPKYEVGDWVKYRNGKEKEEIGCIKTVESEYDICIYGVGYISESQIKCKVKPVKLQFVLCKNKMGYYIPQTYFDVNTSILNNPDYHSTHSITIYEEVEDET